MIQLQPTLPHQTSTLLFLHHITFLPTPPPPKLTARALRTSRKALTASALLLGEGLQVRCRRTVGPTRPRWGRVGTTGPDGGAKTKRKEKLVVLKARGTSVQREV